MSVKYYTHFIAQSEDAIEYNEYRGVVELLGRTREMAGDRDIARMLARSFDLEENDIQFCSGISCTERSDPLAGFTSLH